MLISKISIPEKTLAAKVDEANDRKLLTQAAALYKEIDSRRPQWGLASSLGAKIASRRARMDGIKSAAPKTRLHCGKGPFEMGTIE